MKSNKTLTLEKLIADALEKDAGPLGDVTSIALIPKDQLATANFIIKASRGVVSGLDVLKLVFKLADKSLIFTPLIKDGQSVKKGQVVATIYGSARSILGAERVALEYLRRLSGIATATSEFVAAVSQTKTKILDTRKTFPGYGKLEKRAVLDGGGNNHRFNLSQMGLIKNNHVDLLGGDIKKAIPLFREKYPNIPLEVEVRNQSELKEALAQKPDRILLDNMDVKSLQDAVKLRNSTSPNTPLEASGNMTLPKVKSVAKTGVEYISVGALTHSVAAFDISLHINFI